MDPGSTATSATRWKTSVPQTRIYRAWHVPQWKDPSNQHLALLAECWVRLEERAPGRRLITRRAGHPRRGRQRRRDRRHLHRQRDGQARRRPAEAEREIDAIIAELLERADRAELARAQNTGWPTSRAASNAWAASAAAPTCWPRA
jgi:hypothetical protein